MTSVAFLKSCSDPKPNSGDAPICLQVGDLGRQRRLALQRRDPRQLAVERLQAARVDRRLVHAGGIVGADLLRVGIGRRRLLRRLEDAVQHVTVVLHQLAEAAPLGLVGGNRVVLHPGAAGVLVEVGARTHGLIHRRRIERLELARLPGGPRLDGAPRECQHDGQRQSHQHRGLHQTYTVSLRQHAPHPLLLVRGARAFRPTGTASKPAAGAAARSPHAARRGPRADAVTGRPAEVPPTLHPAAPRRQAPPRPGCGRTGPPAQLT